MNIRPYQQETLDRLYDWMRRNPGVEHAPIVVMPTGSGKSVVIAELVRLIFETWPEDHPRTLIIVPSKELAEQNAEKLRSMIPGHLSVGFYSASLGKRQPDADVVVGTIGTIASCAHILGNIRMVIVDECHLIRPDGAGRYRKFLNDLAKYCVFRVVGFTATPFRGDGVWLTDGKDPLFTGIAHEVHMPPLMQAGFLAPMVLPGQSATRIDVSDVSIATTGDYQVDELDEAVRRYLPSVVNDCLSLAADRSKWLAFTPTVESASELVGLLIGAGISATLVCGETPKAEREKFVAQFRAGHVRCLVTVMALAVGFDVPDVDCLIWCRPTISPVLYVQGLGRGMRIATGKVNCLWLDFTDTTDRMGPVDKIRGRIKRATQNKRGEAPSTICEACGNQIPTNARICPECGHEIPRPVIEYSEVSRSAVLSAHQAQRINHYAVTNVTYHLHHKEGSPDSMRVEYWSGLRVVVREYLCPEHSGFAKEKAMRWAALRMPDAVVDGTRSMVALALKKARKPSSVLVNESGKWPEIVSFEWGNYEQNGIPTATEDRSRAPGMAQSDQAELLGL